MNHYQLFWLKYLAISGLSLAVIIASLDTAITNTALPYIGKELNSSFIQSIWIINSYQLVMAALMLPLTVLSDRIGYKKVFLSGLCIFIVASFLCGYAHSIHELIFARALQGLGAASILGTNIALVRLLYTPKELGFGLGINAFIIALGLAGGPVAASIILSKMSWHWLFLVNIPIGICALIFSLFLPNHKNNVNTPFNYVSAIFTIIMFSCIIYALGEYAVTISLSWVLLFLLIGIISAIFLFIRDSKHNQPIFPFDLFQNSIFSLSIFTGFSAFVTQGLMFVALPYILFKYGLSALYIGFLIAPWPIMGALVAPLAGLLTNHFSAAHLGNIGLLLLGSSIAVLASFNGELPIWAFVIIMMMCGLGFGLFLTPNQRLLLSSAPLARSGVAGGMLNVARISGQTLGATLVAFSLHLSNGPIASMLWIGAMFAFIATLSSIFRSIR
ncbi:MFS transporter [Acinetobacter sp. S40]|uniref:MFS transporter n=1 Tax=Acinetobacter sp. S40 TaxID=2767434 RepID=UPI00190C49D5|nr:MFS transporter [Acinetobacter sp. S40]MBJ9984578.1 MFS transporter [Acinetobacter sp. S40]